MVGALTNTLFRSVVPFVPQICLWVGLLTLCGGVGLCALWGRVVSFPMVSLRDVSLPTVSFRVALLPTEF